MGFSFSLLRFALKWSEPNAVALISSLYWSKRLGSGVVQFVFWFVRVVFVQLKQWMKLKSLVPPQSPVPLTDAALAAAHLVHQHRHGQPAFIVAVWCASCPTTWWHVAWPVQPSPSAKNHCVPLGSFAFQACPPPSAGHSRSAVGQEQEGILRRLADRSKKKPPQNGWGHHEWANLYSSSTGSGM